MHNSANMQRLFGAGAVATGEADGDWDAPKTEPDAWDDDDDNGEKDVWDDSPQLKPAATPDTPPSPGGGRFSLNSPKQKPSSATVLKPKNAVSVASPVRRPEEELDRHAAQLAKLDVDQEGGVDQLLVAARKRVDANDVAALIMRVALTKGLSQGDGAKPVIAELDALAPTISELTQASAAQDGEDAGHPQQLSLLKLCESWFSQEGGLAAAAERMALVGKAVPKVLHALYDADAVEEDSFNQWWNTRPKSSSKGEAGRLFEEQAGKFLEWLGEADEDSTEDEDDDDEDDEEEEAN